MTLQVPLIDDIAFAVSISPEIGALYKSAKEYSADLPDYSLGRLRGLAHLVCDVIAQTDNFTFPQGCHLVKKIDSLAKKKLIARGEEILLNSLREDGNCGVHPENYYLSAQEWIALADKNLINARTMLEFTFQCLYPLIPMQHYEVATVDSGNLKTLCYQAMFEADPQAQHLAGKLFLGKAEAYEKKFIESLPPGGGVIGQEYGAFKKQAYFLFSQAADILHAPSMYVYGRALAGGLEGDVKKSEGEMLVYRASHMGHADANAFIGGCYLNGSLSFDIDYEEARRYLELAAAEDNPFALANLGAMHQKGWGGPQDQVAAAVYTRKAAEAGYPQGQYNLYVLYSHGLGVEHDDAKALEWLIKAADQHFPRAMLALAEMAARGQVSGQGTEQAEQLFYRCFYDEESGNSARYGLARLLITHHPNHQRFVQAAHLLQECYEQEDAVGELAQKCWDLAPEVIAQIKLGIRFINTKESVEQAMAIFPYFDHQGHPHPNRQECISQLLKNLKKDKAGMPTSAAVLAQLSGGMVSGPVNRANKFLAVHRPNTLKIGRNSICPSCDSGKKYKICCGR